MNSQPVELLAGFPVVITLPVQWGDQDAFQHVNNTVYFRWFESARIVYLDRIGLSASMERERIGPILAAIECHYRRPVTYPDTVHIGARVTRIGNSSVTMEHAIASESQKMIVAEGTSTIVVLDYSLGKSIRVADPIRDAIASLEGRPTFT